MKEVKNQGEQVKKNFKLDIVSLIKKGFRPSQISKKLNISLPRLSYHLSLLKRRGLIKKIGYGTWVIDPIEEVKISSNTTNSKLNNSVRGHAFVWKVQAKRLKDLNWKKILSDKKIPYEEKGLAKYPRILIEGKKVILGKRNIVIYEPKSFFGKNAVESRKYAVYSLLEVLRGLENALGIQIKGFRFKPNREHFSLIKNELSKQCRKNGEKINVYNEKGHWLSIDNSFNIDELENLGSMENKPLGTSLQVQKWFNNHKDTNFKVTPDFILNTMNGIQQNQLIFDKNMTSHLKVLNKIGNAVDDLRKEIKKMRTQTKLGDFL